MDIEAQVLEVIKDLFVRSEKGVLSVKNITGAFINRYGDEYEKTISPKSIGTIIRKRLHVKTQKSRGVFVIPLSEKPKLDLLWERFGNCPRRGAAFRRGRSGKRRGGRDANRSRGWRWRGHWGLRGRFRGGLNKRNRETQKLVVTVGFQP